MVSMNAVWDDSIAFIRREAALLVPLALSTLVLGDIVSTLASLRIGGDDTSPVAVVIVVLAAIWRLVGQLAIIGLVLKPNFSVGEALALGASRLPLVLVIGIIVLLVFLVALVPLGAGLISTGFDPMVPENAAKLPAWATAYIVALIALFAWAFARFATLNPLIVDKRPNLVTAIKTSFAMTRGLAARLLGVLILYVIVAGVLGAAIRFVFGAVFAILGRATASPYLGEVLVAIVTGLVSGALSLIATVFLASLYRRLSSGT